jgi:hypothetical protein
MAETEILPQKIVDTRTLILKSRFDSNAAMLQVDKLKTSFFVKYGFLKPNPRDVVLTAFTKYYESYIVIGGKYSIDYCKRHDYVLEVEDSTEEIFVDGKKLKAQFLTPEKTAKVIKLLGEEHSHYEKETYLVLDRLMREVQPENLPFAPFEHETENRPEGDFDLRKPKITLEQEIVFLRSRIAKRPPDVAEIIREIFEITERTIIYTPIYEANFQNNKNGKNITLMIDGITGEVVIGKTGKRILSKKLPVEALERCDKGLSEVKAELPVEEAQATQTLNDSYVSNSTIKNPVENSVEKASDILPDSYQSEGPQSSAEETAFLAAAFLKRLGYAHGRVPTKISLEGENEVVELGVPEGTARIQIDTKTKAVKEYEIQETEMQQGFFKSKRKLLLLASLIIAIAVALKLMNIF